MNWHAISGQWTQLKGKLMDDELEAIAGSREKFLGKLQEKHGLSRDEAERQLEEWQRYVKI
jgi:uncharacterized protein YjbJ (UPF0337 family)